MERYDLVVIGAGPGGAEAAALAAAQGLKVAIVEKGLVGGTCLNRGCIPTKCLCAGAAACSPDFGAARAHATEVMDTLRADLEASLKEVDIYRGEARLAQGRTIVAGTDFLKADKIIVATGSRPAALPIEGIEHTIDSDKFLSLAELPQRIAIIGGGVIGLEFASLCTGFGAQVTVLEYCREVLPGCDVAIAKRLRTYLSRRGVKFVTGAQVKSVAPDKSVTYEQKGKSLAVEADVVLCAVGRRAVLPEGLAEAGVEVNERGFIATDANFATTAEGIYAIGDVNGRCMLAHAAYAQADIVVGATDTVGLIPSVVYTDPECAWVGAKEDDSDAFRAVTVPYSANAKALADGHTEGALKLVFNEQNIVVGCQAVGHNASALIAQATIAIDAGYTLRRLAYNTVAAHPSLSELLTTAASTAL